MNLPQQMLSVLLIGCAVLGLSELEAKGEDETRFSDAQLEHFEKHIRPLLAKRCYACHSSKAKKLQGGLRMDTRRHLLAGGDSGAAIEPGKPDDSLLIQAIRYDGDYKMPPKSKLPAGEIKLLEEWIRAGAAWPAETANSKRVAKTFDLGKRKREHWAWRPINAPAIPLKDARWPRDNIDHFVLRRLAENGLKPNNEANREVLIRRLYFDLIGLPPSPEQVAAYKADKSPKATEKVVDGLLRSHHFGERWARHWMDLVRYAESRGHEFDYTAPNAFEYRDYLIRAFNQDVPYDKFIVEHIAGDLLAKPRRNPDGGNESIVGTAFWHLGEWCHSPVDIRQDEADRNDNMIDVFGKTFLAMTIACARCHDHKFDAISQRDYYAMSGFLQSSSFRLARFDTMNHNRKIAAQISQWRRTTSKSAARTLSKLIKSESVNWGTYLHAAIQVVDEGPDATTPAAASQSDQVLFDFESGNYDGWRVEGDAFGPTPQTQKTLAKYQGNVKAAGKFFVNSHHKRKGGRGDGGKGRLISKRFKVTHPYLTFLVGGGSHANRTCVDFKVEGKRVASVTGKNKNEMHRVTLNVIALIGREMHIEIVDQQAGGWGNIGADDFVLTHKPKGELVGSRATASYQTAIKKVAEQSDLDPARLGVWVDEIVLKAKESKEHPLHGLIANAKVDPASVGLKLDDWNVIADYRNKTTKWFVDGVGFGLQALSKGELVLGGTAKEPRIGVAPIGMARTEDAFNQLRLKAGSQNNSGRIGSWQRAGRILKTSTFQIKSGHIHWLVRGAGRIHTVVDTHYMINGPLHGETIKEWKDKNGQWQWVTQNVTLLKGHRAHCEISPLPSKPLEVVAIVEGKPQPPVVPSFGASGAFASLAATDKLEKRVNGHVSRLSQLMLDALANKSLSSSQLSLANWGLTHAHLLLGPTNDRFKNQLQTSFEHYEELSRSIKNESRLTMAMWDGSGEDEYVFVRGSHKRSAGDAPRQLLTAIVGEKRIRSTGSGRLELANDVASAENPLTSRVIVNRVWHHLFGRGIVPSVDNFGVLGEKPSHPELLDFLATEFVKDNWSIKRLIKRIVLTRTYQMSSEVNPAYQEKDPGNVWLHRANVKRLEGEIIRDAVLAMSGQLDRGPYQGPSVPVFLTEFMTGRGRPRGGPLDGDGRRSVFLSVRRNFLSPMMLAFDMPQPFSSMGRRTVSNVPAQALILLNDPLVVSETKRWGTRLALLDRPAEARVRQMYQEAFARHPTKDELSAALSFLQTQAERHSQKEQWKTSKEAWQDLCHVIVNVKEFIYIP